MTTRRAVLGLAALTGMAAVSRSALARLPDPQPRGAPATAQAAAVSGDVPYRGVVTLNGWTLPPRLNGGVKEFHLVAEPVVRELAPGSVAHLWGYNGSSPGPTIEVVEGDRVRLYVTNRVPEHTSVHWHGQRLPNGMDGVGGLNQPAIPVGKTFLYEFVARRPGTFMYHPHADEMVQMAMGLMGFWVTHPRKPHPWIAPVDRDYCILLNAYDIEPGAAVPKINTMLDFNLWTWNSRTFPGIDPLVARQGERVRIRLGNLTMTNHPIHLHGHEFEVTGTDGGPTRPESRWPEVTVDIAVGQMRQVEFIADEEGDWAIHCHKSHHTMNAMGHAVPTLIGVEQRGLAGRIARLTPGYMAMGERGMADMTEMAMAIPENTVPMMTGDGPFGSVEMGGMFSVFKVRRDLVRGVYADPGWFAQGPRAGEVTDAPAPIRAPAAASAANVRVKKPNPAS